MSASHWRTMAAPIIADILAESEGETTAEIRAKLRDAYPFGPKAMHPYKMWLKEIRHQMGEQSKTTPKHPRYKELQEAIQRRRDRMAGESK